MAKNDRQGAFTALNNIYLTGFMCAGKTSSGTLLARRLRRTFVDGDRLFEREHGLSPASYIRNRGLGAFRKAEAALIRGLARGRALVVALGGGVYPSPRWRTLFGSTGVTVFLRCPWRELEARLKRDRSGRPLLDGEWGTARARARKLYDKRLTFYRRADITVSTAGLTPAQAAAKAEKALRRKAGGLRRRAGENGGKII